MLIQIGGYWFNPAHLVRLRADDHGWPHLIFSNGESVFIHNCGSVENVATMINVEIAKTKV